LSMQNEEPKAIKRVEDFIERLHNLDYVIDEKAQRLVYFSEISDWGIGHGRKGVLSDLLANAISEYELNRDNPTLKWKAAQKCLIWIDKAFASGVVQEGKGLVSKYKELEREIKHLQERFDECNRRRQILEEENKSLRKLFPKDTFTGDVQGE